MNILILILLLLLAGGTGIAIGFFWCATIVLDVARRSGYRFDTSSSPARIVPLHE